MHGRLAWVPNGYRKQEHNADMVPDSVSLVPQIQILRIICIWIASRYLELAIRRTECEQNTLKEYSSLAERRPLIQSVKGNKALLLTEVTRP